MNKPFAGSNFTIKTKLQIIKDYADWNEVGEYPWYDNQHSNFVTYAMGTYLDKNGKELDEETVLEWLEDLCLNDKHEDPDCVKILAKFEDKEKIKEMHNLVFEIFNKPLKKVSIKELKKEMIQKSEFKRSLNAFTKNKVNSIKNKDFKFDLDQLYEKINNHVGLLKNAINTKL